jgi:acyl carrier protein
MNESEVLERTRRVVDSALALRGRALQFSASTRLLGALPELDSMAVVLLIVALQDEFGIVFDDDDLGADTMATLGSLCAFVLENLARQGHR